MECNDVFAITIWFRFKIRWNISSADSNNIAVEWPIEIEEIDAVTITSDFYWFILALIVESMSKNCFVCVFRDAGAALSWVKNLTFWATYSTLDWLKAGTGFLIELKAFFTLFLALDPHYLYISCIRSNNFCIKLGSLYCCKQDCGDKFHDCL